MILSNEFLLLTYVNGSMALLTPPKQYEHLNDRHLVLIVKGMQLQLAATH